MNIDQFVGIYLRIQTIPVTNFHGESYQTDSLLNLNS